MGFNNPPSYYSPLLHGKPSSFQSGTRGSVSFLGEAKLNATASTFHLQAFCEHDRRCPTRLVTAISSSETMEAPIFDPHMYACVPVSLLLAPLSLLQGW